MRALLSIGARLQEGQVGKLEDWRALFYRLTDSELSRWRRSVRLERLFVVDQLKQWLSIGKVQIEPSWESDVPVLRVGVPGLFGALAIQLTLAISRTDGLAVCSACGLSYIPSRRPRAAQRRYCLPCRERKVPQRDAARDFRRRATESR